MLELEDAVELSVEAQYMSPFDLDTTLLQHPQRGDLLPLSVQRVIDFVVFTSDSNGSECGANALSRDLNGCWERCLRMLLAKERQQLQNLVSTSNDNQRSNTLWQKALDYYQGHFSISEARRPQRRDRYCPD